MRSQRFQNVIGRGRLGSGPIDFEPFMDLINLQSDNPARFTMVGSKISAWTEQNGVTQWTESNDSLRPTYPGGVPTFGGNGVGLVRSGGDVSATDYTLFCVVRNTSEATAKALFASTTGTNWYDIGSTTFVGALKIGGADVYRANVGYKGKRDTVLCIRKSGNTVTIFVNNRACVQTLNNFAGQTTLFGRLMSITGFSSFALAGTLKAFCLSSIVMSDAVVQDVVNSLYIRYNLGLNLATDTIIGFGDSNTAGQGSTSYLVGLASQMGLAFTQAGISGSLFTTNNASSGYTRYASQIVSKPLTDYLVVQYCTNDVGNVSPSAYAIEFNAMMNDLVNVKGWNPSRICLVTPPYQRDNVNAALLDQFAAVYSAAATLYGTKFWDFLTWMRNNGGNSLLSDNVHVLQAAQNAMQAGVFNAFTT